MANPIVHIDISGPDEAAQHRFYAELFGWSVDSKGPGYALLGTPTGSPNGALIEAEEASVTFGVGVPDLEASVATAVTLGARVVMPPTNNGWVTKAQVCDPGGNVVTLIQS